MQKKILFLTLVTILLAGCLPAQAPQDISSQVNTAVAETAQANTQIALIVEQTVAAQFSPTPAFTATLQFSATPEPTFEIIIIEPDTPIPPPPATDEPAPPAPVPQAYDCFVETRSPEYYEEFKAGGTFEIRWFVINTGTKAWDSGIDVSYASGPQMTTQTRVEISKALKPGESYKITLSGKAPNQPGNYTMSWIVQGQLCYANVNISVK